MFISCILYVNEEKLIQKIFLLMTKYIEIEVFVLPLAKNKLEVEEEKYN